MDEREIREACASNPELGFKMLMNEFQKPLYGYIRRLVVSHDDTEDVLQEVFIRVFRHLKHFRAESSLTTWMYRIATNESLRLLNNKRECPLCTEELREVLTEKLLASEYVDYDNEMAVKFQKAVLTLPEKQRIVFNLRYYDELGYDAIAQIAGSTPESAKVNYHYAKERIKEYMTNN